jgi:D-alanine-D-alanine ligase
MAIGKDDIDDKRAFFKKKKIGVLMGGVSEEREISLKSGSAVVKALEEMDYKAVLIDFSGSRVVKTLLDEEIEVAFIALHGRGGEDGTIQGLLEIMEIPYTGSGVRASAIAMDKVTTKMLFMQCGVPTPDFRVVSGKVTARSPLSLPVIVKPASQGSTIGITLVDRDSDYKAALTDAYKYGDRVLVEKFIKGRELTVSVIGETVYPTVEIIPRRGIYDFKAKYVKGETEFKAPAVLDEDIERRVAMAARVAYDCIGCAGGARVDVVINSEGEPFVLEVNTVPGMTDLSLFPMAAAVRGIGYGAIVEELLFGARLKGC